MHTWGAHQVLRAELADPHADDSIAWIASDHVASKARTDQEGAGQNHITCAARRTSE